MRIASQKQPKDKHLKDITNNLHVSSANFKPKDKCPRSSSRKHEMETSTKAHLDSNGLNHLMGPLLNFAFPQRPPHLGSVLIKQVANRSTQFLRDFYRMP